MIRDTVLGYDHEVSVRGPPWKRFSEKRAFLLLSFFFIHLNSTIIVIIIIIVIAWFHRGMNAR